MSDNKPEFSSSSTHQPTGTSNAKPSIPKHDMPATRLFKVLNPELFMKPNRLIMYGGVVAMAGIVFWLGSSELEHRQNQSIIEGASAKESDLPSPQRASTYQERMAELKRNSSQ
ncbi:hypothetical protein LPJ72_000480 [Coemansia sp. Benny D160-2]|nr:hypothetical protein LPJ72_000480 [Coemansia sp. Benny D160-2]